MLPLKASKKSVYVMYFKGVSASKSLSIPASNLKDKASGFALYDYFSFFDLIRLVSLVSTVALSVADPVTDVLAIITFLDNPN